MTALFDILFIIQRMKGGFRCEKADPVLIFPLGAAALTQSQQESLPAVSTEEVHGNVPAQTNAAQAMTPAVHALVLAMTENHLDYDPSDSEFLWTSLYYMLSLYGQMDERA